MEQKLCESIGCWTPVVTLNFDLTHDLDLGFSRTIFNSHSFGMGGLSGYTVGRTIGLLLGHSALQIHWSSNGSMWNCFSFKPVVPWIGCPFTDRRAEGCWRSLYALFTLTVTWNLTRVWLPRRGMVSCKHYHFYIKGNYLHKLHAQTPHQNSWGRLSPGKPWQWSYMFDKYCKIGISILRVVRFMPSDSHDTFLRHLSHTIKR